MTATITDADRAAAQAAHFDVGDSYTDLFIEHVAQAIADAREAATLAERAACVEWVRGAEGDGVANDLAAARMVR